MYWELRYRAKHVDDVWIHTDGDTEAEARVVADYYLSTLASPNVVFVRLRPIVVMSTRAMKKAKGELEPPPPAPAPAVSAAARALNNRKKKKTPAATAVEKPAESQAPV